VVLSEELFILDSCFWDQ